MYLYPHANAQVTQLAMYLMLQPFTALMPTRIRAWHKSLGPQLMEPMPGSIVVTDELQRAFGYFGTVAGVVVDIDGNVFVNYANGYSTIYRPM